MTILQPSGNFIVMVRIGLIILLFHSQLYAQIFPGPRSLALGSASAALTDSWSVQQNPAGISELKSPVLALSYEQHFLDPELSSQNATLVLPFNKHVIGLSFSRYGFSEYLEQSAGFVYARSFSGTLSLAIALRTHQMHISNYGNEAAYSLDAGMQFHLTENILIGSSIRNPGRSGYKDSPGTYLPVSLSVGISCLFGDKVLVLSDIEKVLGNSMNLKSGIEYKPVQSFVIRGGVSLNPYKQHAGFGFYFKGISVDAAITSHPNLGFSPNLGLSYEF